MSTVLLEPRHTHLPEFGAGEWLNTPHPLTRSALRGRVLLIDFWDYTCINCIRTLPYLTAWHERYASLGLTIIGVHAPEFTFARGRGQVETAVAEFGIGYPVLLDNEYETWDRYANRAWPTKYLIDAEGYLRYTRRGEGYYQEVEQALQALLRLRDPDVTLPKILPLLRAEDVLGAACYRPTPELYTGFERGALGNEQGYAPGHPMVYQLPLRPEWREGAFYAGGIWRAGRDFFSFAGQDGGRIVLPYSAASVSVVLSPSADPVEVMLNLRAGEAEPLVEVRQDNIPLTSLNAGADIIFPGDGMSAVRVERPRLFELVRNPAFESHELELVFHASGLALYAFTFTTCVKPGGYAG